MTPTPGLTVEPVRRRRRHLAMRNVDELSRGERAADLTIEIHRATTDPK